MRRPGLAVAALLAGALVAPAPAAAWSQAGHEVIATVAYRGLPASTRRRVDELLRRHPDVSRLARGLDAARPDFGLLLFLRAARWADDIKDDPRFFDDTDPAAPPTPAPPGFPDMALHRDWHYVDRAFSTDGTPVPAGPVAPGALSRAGELAAAVADERAPTARRAYDLAWLIHLVGDLHQPLHATSRASRRHPGGDRGGNAFLLRGDDRNLHRFWDGLIAPSRPFPEMIARADALRAATTPDALEVALGDDPAAALERWAAESVTLARDVAYALGEERSGPLAVPGWYRRLGEEVARRRAVVAGHRLAALLVRCLP
jgi:hypothetical protein